MCKKRLHKRISIKGSTGFLWHRTAKNQETMGRHGIPAAHGDLRMEENIMARGMFPENKAESLLQNSKS